MPKPNADVTDAELLAAMGRGDAHALEQLYIRHADLVRRVLTRHAYGTNPSDISDLVQEVFLTAMAGAARYREQGKPRAWLCGIALRTARKAYQRSRRRTGLLERFGWVLGHRVPRTSEVEEAATAHVAMERALRTLKPEQREVLLLHSVERLSGQEIAEILGVEVKTVWTRVFRARAALESALEGGEHGERGGQHDE